MVDVLSGSAFLGFAVLLALVLRRRQAGGRDQEQEEALWAFPFDDEPRSELSLLDALPRGFTEPQAVLVDDFAGLARLREALRDATVLAIDVEAHGGSRVCCVQLAVGREAFVVDTLRPDVAALLPQALGRALASPTCTKLLHSGRNDVMWLRSLGMTIAPPLFDTALAAAALELPTNLGGLALSLLAGEGSAPFKLFLAHFADTKSEYQRSDWSVRPIAQDMLVYAAADAALLLPVARGQVARLTPAALSGVLEASSLMLGSVRARPAVDGRVQAPSPRVTRQERIAQGVATAAARAKVKERRGAALFIPRSSPLYSNIELLHPNGTVIARVDRKKASWYLANGAVDVFTGHQRRAHLDVAGMFEDASMDALAALEQPVALRLRKPPRGMGHAGDVFHLAERANNCVVCGRGWIQRDGSSEERNGLVRCYLLPRTHRHHLPLAAKSYTSHDVVLTCTNCHVRADSVSSGLARTLCQELGVATGSGALSRLSAQWADASRWRTQGSEEAAESSGEAAGEGGPGWTTPKESAAAALGNCRRVAHTLSLAWSSMPEERRRELAAELAAWLASESLGGAAGAAAVVPAIVRVLSGEEDGEDEKEAVGRSVPERRRTPARKPLRVRPTAASSAFMLEWPAFTATCPGGAAGLPSCDAMLVLAGIPHSSRIAPLVLEAMAEAAGVTGTAAGGNVPLPLWADPAAHVLRHIILGTPSWHAVVEKGVYEHVLEPVIMPEPEAPGAATGLSGFPFDSEARLTLFIRRWRAHVHAELAPTALPVGWRVDYKVVAQGHRTWDKAEPELVQLLARELGLPERPPPSPLD
jgi:hypothetical protein